MSAELSRCPWSLSTQQYRDYHDHEWGRPCHDEQRLFEMLLLEGAQAGLSWRTILEKREGYRVVFDGFDAPRMAGYSDAELEAKLKDARIVRNRLKVFGFRRNAAAYLRLCESEGSLDAWLWQHVGGKTVLNHWAEHGQVPATTMLSDAISKQLKKRGFTFVGSTIVYAWLQSMGVVNDHLTRCAWHPHYAG
ncbi:MAG: DNA-3-methyladenine glycosylase I [Pseudomonadota bacterium]